MINLYPIVRRVRRPLLPVDEQAASVVPTAFPQDATPEAPVMVPEPSPVSEVPEAKPTRKNEAKRKQA